MRLLKPPHPTADATPDDARTTARSHPNQKDTMSYTLRNLLIAVALGFVGIMLTTSYITKQRAELSRGQDEVKLLVATKDIPAGTKGSTLQDGGYVEFATVLREDAPPQPVSDVKDVAKLSLQDAVYEGEYLTGHKFDRESQLNPTEQIKGTDRMMSLPLNAPQQLAGMIKPGDHVDIWASDGKRTWIAARDVVIIQTPESLAPQGEEAAPAAPAKATGEALLFILQVPDKVVHDLMFSYHAADGETKLWPALRPSEGDTESELPPLTDLPDVS